MRNMLDISNIWLIDRWNQMVDWSDLSAFTRDSIKKLCPCALQWSIVVRHNDIISLWGYAARNTVVIMQWKKMDLLRNQAMYWIQWTNEGSIWCTICPFRNKINPINCRYRTSVWQWVEFNRCIFIVYPNKEKCLSLWYIE
jgi:hypothetical protein